MTETFFAPSFVVIIGGQKMTTDHSRYIISVSVTQELDGIDNCCLQIANPYPQLPWTHGHEANLLVEGGEVQIRMGYVGRTPEIFRGTITSSAAAFAAEGVSSIEVRAQTALFRMQSEPRSRAFQNRTDSEIVSDLVQGLPMRTDIETTSVRYPYVLQYNQTDLAFLQERARRIGFRISVEQGVLHFKSEIRQQQAEYTLVWGQPGQPTEQGQRIRHLVSFSPHLKLQGLYSAVHVSGQHPTTREVLSGKASAGDEPERLGAKTASEFVAELLKPDPYQISHQPLQHVEEAQELAHAILQRSSFNLVTANGSTIGVPELRPGILVDIKGVGPKYSGLYLLSETTHTIGADGYRTSFVARRNAIG